MKAASEKIRERLVGLVLHFHVLLLLTVAVVLLLGNGGIAADIRDLPALLFLVSGLLLLCSAAFLSFRLKSRLALLAVSLSVSIYGFEFGIRILAPPRTHAEVKDMRMAQRAARARKLGLPFDARNLLEVILDYRQNGKFVYPSGNIETYLKENLVSDIWANYRAIPSIARRPVLQIDDEEVLPLGQPAHHLCVGTDNENGQYVVFKTDEHGFRNPPGLWSLGNIDIVGLGDSFTEGCEVRDEQSFMSRIRKRFPRTVNLGIGGGGPWTILAGIREYGRVLKPKVALWCFFEGNDLGDMAARMQVPILRRYLQKAFRQDLIHRQPQLDEAIRDFLENAVAQQKEIRNRGAAGIGVRLCSFITLEHLRTKLGAAPAPNLLNLAPGWNAPVGRIEWATGRRLVQEEWQCLEEILSMAKADVESWGGKLYFVYLPTWQRVADPRFQVEFAAPDTENAQDQRNRVLEIVHSLNLNLIDLTPAFAHHDDPLSLFPFRLQGHYNSAGYEMVANEIIRNLAKDPALIAAERQGAD